MLLNEEKRNKAEWPQEEDTRATKGDGNFQKVV